MRSSISLVRSDGVPDAGIARYFSAILETVGKLWECGKCGKTGGVGKWISFLPPNYNRVLYDRRVSHTCNTARYTVRDGQISVFQNSNHTRGENRYSFLYPTGVVLLNKGSIQNTLWDVACGLCNWDSTILKIMSVIVAV